MHRARRTFPTLPAKEAVDAAEAEEVAAEVEVEVAVAVAAAVVSVEEAARMPVGRNRTSAAGKPS